MLPSIPLKKSGDSDSPSTLDKDPDIQAIRAFNRFYTQRAEILEPYLGSDFSLTEARVMYELAQRGQTTAVVLSRELALDAGYLSRIIKRFEKQGWLRRLASAVDGRQMLLELTSAGHEVFAPLQQKSCESAATLLGSLKPTGRTQLLGAMASIQKLLSLSAENQSATRVIVLRDPAPGDMGWVVQQHGEIYAREFGWDISFEARVAEIAAQFLNNFQPAWEKGWIAELDGERVGAIFVVRQSDEVAKLRMLILTPAARGLGLGGKLTDECVRFARNKGYKMLELWTHSCLEAARVIYSKRGFRLIHSEPYEGFGQKLVSETWQLQL
ncbi:MAG: helix-turn-helix domain-containing GNAT family N-acetyltransferase [Pseudomonadota bacterium]